MVRSTVVNRSKLGVAPWPKEPPNPPFYNYNCKFYNYLRSGIPWWYGGCYGTGNVFCRYIGAERGVFRAWGPCICQKLILVHSPISRISEDPTLGGWFSELRKYFWSGFVLNHNFRTRSVRLAGFYCLNRHYMIRADLWIDSPPPQVGVKITVFIYRSVFF